MDKYIIRWHSDGELAVVDANQIEAIRHSEKKHYGGVPQMTVIRKATDEEIAFHSKIGMKPMKG